MKVHACDLAPNDLRSAARPTLSKYRAGERVARSIDAQRRESSPSKKAAQRFTGRRLNDLRSAARLTRLPAPTHPSPSAR
jgi:hypothetical protein